MKRDYAWLAVFIGATILIIGIFFEEFLFGLEIPIEILALSFSVFALYRIIRNEKERQ